MTTGPSESALARLARWRVPAGFVCAAVAYGIAAPTLGSILLGGLVGLPGEALRVWAAGHLVKGREVTGSGPYRFFRHPLYLGSTFLGAGFAVASHALVVAGLVAVYMSTTLLIAVRAEEAILDARFAGAYTAYREGRAAPVDRPFSLQRVAANHEFRTMAGFVMALALMYVRSLVTLPWN